MEAEGNKIMKHLWEIDHAYYCNEGNYYSTECGEHFKSFSDFMYANGNSDFDYNLVFRFDWVEGEDEGASEFNGDVNYRNGLFKVFWMGQRKGIYRYSVVEVCRADEEKVLEFLKPRWEYMKELWEGVTE